MKQMFVDTNYILRLLLKDKEEHYIVVRKLFDEAIQKKVKLYTSLIVIFEVYWVLSSVYEQSKETCINTVENLLRLDFFSIPDRLLLFEALDIHKTSSLSFEDGYNVAFKNQYPSMHFVTFDRKLQNYLKK
jgi:predicted nucleic-acid-binding protein